MKYFVVYKWFSKDQNGYGNIEIDIEGKGKIKNYSHIKDVIKYLNRNVKDANGNEVKCIIINYKELK